MFEALKPLIESGILNEETREVLETAWNSKLEEARGAIRAEIREEMANRYEHDKATMVEALDRMVSESLTVEVQKIAAERASITQDRVKFTEAMMAKAVYFEDYLNEALAKEIAELHNDRAAIKSATAKLDEFVTQGLRKEIVEFAEDKADLARAKVQLVVEGKQKLKALSERFIQRSAELVDQATDKTLRTELKQLKEDIQEAKENNFGRRIFEAFATEFTATHLNERAEIRKMQSFIERMEQQLSEARESAEIANANAQAKETEIRRINEAIERHNKINELMTPLSKEKANVMKQLLESTPTDRLEAAFKKYLTPVMEGHAPVPAAKPVLNEAKTAVTGDRVIKQDQLSSNIFDIRRLAGLKTN
jgi:hypothetical protein